MSKSKNIRDYAAECENIAIQLEKIRTTVNIIFNAIEHECPKSTEIPDIPATRENIKAISFMQRFPGFYSALLLMQDNYMEIEEKIGDLADAMYAAHYEERKTEKSNV